MEEKSIIYLEFEEPGSVNFKGSSIQNVSPLQMLAVAGWLEFHAKHTLNIEYAQNMQRERERLAKPKIELPGTLKS